MAPVCKKITKISKMAQDDIIEELPIGSIVSARNTTTEYILQYVRSLTGSFGSKVEALYRLMDNRVEALEFHVTEHSPVVGIPLLNLSLKKNLLVCGIVRGKKIITPSGRDTIELGDTVIVVTTNKGLDDITDILSE